MPDFLNGRQLRDYQRHSLEWNICNWAAGRNCILGDEVRPCAILCQLSSDRVVHRASASLAVDLSWA